MSCYLYGFKKLLVSLEYELLRKLFLMKYNIYIYYSCMTTQRVCLMSQILIY
jgi:hypothetical protein